MEKNIANSGVLNIHDLKILVAEDDDASFLYLKIILENHCKSILLARTGKEVIELMDQNPDVGLILMDIKMPELNGLEATSIIRKKFPHVKIIAQSAYAFTTDITKAREAGCDEFITKPISKNELFRMINLYFPLQD